MTDKPPPRFKHGPTVTRDWAIKTARALAAKYGMRDPYPEEPKR